jgi:hypothetical protein
MHRARPLAALLVGCVLTATADVLEEKVDQPPPPQQPRRQLQALDLNICDKKTNLITRRVGTLHDDQTGKVDCSKGGCSGKDRGHNGYGDNLHCGKVLSAPKGYTVQLIFTHLSLGAGKNCGKTKMCDYIAVYDGADDKAPLLGKFSGTKEPPSLRSTGQTVFVLFVTDTGNYEFQVNKEHKDPGFLVNWHFNEAVSIHGGKDENAGDLCPMASVMTTAHGSIHDDERSGIDCVKVSCIHRMLLHPAFR